jgi:FtsZ-interacting cell division protein ZipA
VRFFDPGKRWIIVDAGQLIGIIVGIVVVLAIIAVAIVFSRKRKVDADRNRAAEIREKAKADEITAREREAKAARAEAEAQEAEVNAERLRQEARGRQQEAGTVRSGAQEQLRKADEMDPDVVTSRRGDASARDETTGDASSRGARAGRDRNGPDRVAGDDGTHNRGEDPNKGDRPRNL